MENLPANAEDMGLTPGSERSPGVGSSVQFSRSVVSGSLQPHGLEATRLLCPWDFPGKNTGVGCHFLLRGILPTQKSNLPVLHWQADSLPLSHLGSRESRDQPTLDSRLEEFVSFTLLMTLTF